MARKLSIKQIATTEDTDDPVVRVEFGAVESRLDAILPGYPEVEAIHVWWVESAVRGDMSTMIDELCSQLECAKVVFLSPLDFSDIRDRIDNYEEVTVDTPEGKQERLVCQWDYE